MKTYINLSKIRMLVDASATKIIQSQTTDEFMYSFSSQLVKRFSVNGRIQLLVPNELANKRNRVGIFCACGCGGIHLPLSVLIENDIIWDTINADISENLFQFMK